MTYKHYPEEVKAAALNMYAARSITVKEIENKLGVSRSSLFRWVRENKEANDTDAFSAANYHRQKLHIKKLEDMVSILQNVDCSVNSPLRTKLYELEKLGNRYSVHTMCEALQISRGTYYNHMRRNKKEDAWYIKRREKLKPIILEVFNESEQRYGYETIAAIIRENGTRISSHMVRRLMEEMDIRSVRNNAKATYIRENRPTRHRCNMLQRQFEVADPNIVWVSDVTLFKVKGVQYYICVILDLFSRKVVGCQIGRRNTSALVKKTVAEALQNRAPKEGLIFHSDRGTNYTSTATKTYLDSLGFTQSLSGKGSPYDNSVIEAFFSQLKQEELYRRIYKSEREFKKSVLDYIDYYNNKRRTPMHKYRTPAEVEAHHLLNPSTFESNEMEL